MKPRHGSALILGASGQDGAYLAELLVRRGLDVHGTSRDKEVSGYVGLRRLGIYDRVTVHSAVLSDFRSVVTVLNDIRPALIFNLAAQSSVGLSFEQPVETIDSIMHGTINVMEAMRFLALDAKFYNAASSECFGNTTKEQPADETTMFSPRSPYAVGKAASFWAVANYREAYGLFACSGLMFNHESPLRPARFVTRKITSAAARIANRAGERLSLGNLSIRRDFGWAPDYVEAMWAMLQQATADDFVIASGVSHSLEEFVAAAFAEVGLDWRDHVDRDPALKRPSDIGCSLGDPAKAARMLGWRAKVDFSEIAARMVRAEREGANAVS